MNSKKRRLYSVLKIIILIFLMVGAVYVSNIVLREKSTIRKNEDFFSQKEDFDVLFFGSSHTEIFVNPMDLWKDFGIVSYNFGNPEESLETSFLLMKNAIEIHKPKVIVLDVAMFNLCENNTNKDHMHYALDSFPISKSKLEAINEALPNINEKIEMIFTLGSYHTRWKELGKEDFINTEYYVKGNMSYGYWHTTKVTPTNQYSLVDGESDNSIKDEKALYKIINMCKQEEIKLLFVANPYCCQDYKQRNIHSVEKIAEAENVDFLNFIDDEFLTDYRVDYYDDDHVNQSGMHKVTYCLGDYIANNYDVIDAREDIRYSDWWKDYRKYVQLKLETLGQMADDINVFLELLHDKDYRTVVYLGGEFKTVVGNETLYVLLQNIGRSNLTVTREKGAKSADLYPLLMLKECIGNEDYTFIVNEGEVEKELVGGKAADIITRSYEGLKVEPDEMVICVSDVYSNEPRVIRKYITGTEGYEDLLYNIEGKVILW